MDISDSYLQKKGCFISFFDNSVGYKTPEYNKDGISFNVNYLWTDYNEKFGDVDFAKKIFTGQDSQSFDSMRRLIAGVGNLDDTAIVMKSRFLFWKFNK